ncbi:hypothetical protein HZH66_000291 [Vespula vulgaris]|uniref:Uncharacterized protein n=1 Tax=Vespula vulgaris TaxID=7454 RepID=A0A834NJL7_VESVU|nr:hypothetical protein HZH66_000291 [Vespula vulgaris]
MSERGWGWVKRDKGWGRKGNAKEDATKKVSRYTDTPIEPFAPRSIYGIRCGSYNQPYPAIENSTLSRI